jgi:hypothetical protein
VGNRSRARQLVLDLVAVEKCRGEDEAVESESAKSQLRQLERSSTALSAGLKALWLSRKTSLKVCLTLTGDRDSKFLSPFP